MNQRQKKVNEALAGAPGRLTAEETQVLENLSLTTDSVKQHGGIITINADDQTMQLCESICKKLGIDPERCVNVRVNKYDAQQ